MAVELIATLVVETDSGGSPGTIFTGSIEPGDATVILLQARAIVLPPEVEHGTVTIQVEHGADNGMFYPVGDPFQITTTEPLIARIEGVLGGFVRLRVTLSSDAAFSVGAAVEIEMMPMPEAVPTVVESRGLPSAFGIAAEALEGRIRIVPEL